jgi:RecA-family ATPase
MLLYGDPKVGKSYAALQLAEAISNGDHWLGFGTNAGKVVYLQFDTPRNVWQERVSDLQKKSGAFVTPFYMGDRESLDSWPFDILNPVHYIRLRDALQAISPALVIFDTLRESHSSDENDSTQMQEAVSALVACCQPAALCLISHARKPVQDQDFTLMGDNRGSSYVVGRMDAIVRFTKKSCRVAGRSIEEHSIDLERLDNGFWAESSEGDYHILSVVLDPQFTSIKAAAESLSKRLNKPEEACRGVIRRYLTAHKDVKTNLA